MSKAKNPVIGKVPCPFAGCGQECDIKKFAHRATRDSGRRFAGRLYFDCPEHGRMGADGRKAMQDYILERGTIWGGKPADDAPALEPVSGASEAEAPAPVPVAAPVPKPARAVRAAPAPVPKRTAPALPARETEREPKATDSGLFFGWLE